MEFLLLRILAIRQPRRSALPYETIGREPGRDGLARAYSQDDWFAIVVASLETETTLPGPVQRQTYDEKKQSSAIDED
jgi:hypothetical protein